MGLAASQARLLNLTSRMHDIEYKAQKLEAQKLQMANESTQVYQEYENALNTTKLQLKQINNDGSASYVDATYDLLTQSGYYVSMIGTGLDGNANKMVVAQSDIDTFNQVGSAEKFAAVKSGMCEVKTVGGVNNCITLAGTNTICIFTVDDLKTHAGSNTEKILMNDLVIDTSSSVFASDLHGTLDGNGHTITVKGTLPLFGALSGATVQNLNLNLDMVESTESRPTGGLARYTSDNTINFIENVNVTGSIKTSHADSIGGLVGHARSGSELTINNVTSTVDITASEFTVNTNTPRPYIAGFVGYSANATLKVTNSQYNGTISTQADAVAGGIVGESMGDLTIENCSTSGSILNSDTTGSYYAGGLAGQVTGSSKTVVISNNESSMIITGGGPDPSVGGVVGYIGGSGTRTTSNNYTKNVQYTGTASYKEIAGSKGQNAEQTSATTSTCTATGAKTSVNHDYTAESSYNYYLNIGKAIESDNYLPAGEHMNNATWLSEMLNSAYILLSKMDSDNNIYNVNVATDTSLQEVSDETLLKKAEAKYEADMRKINQKDKKFDTELAAMDAERNAVKTEMDTLKSVAKENVDRTFKLFG